MTDAPLPASTSSMSPPPVQGKWWQPSQKPLPAPAVSSVVNETPHTVHPSRENESTTRKSPLPDTTAATASAASPPRSVYTVHIADKLGMPAELPKDAPKTFNDLLALCPSPLREQLQQMMETRRWQHLTDVQRAAIPLALEYRDLLCIAPTATGKTFSYVFPTMLRLLLDDTASSTSQGGADGDEDALDLSRRSVESLLAEKIRRGEVCRYCELSVAENRVCPMTGVPHPPPPDPVWDALALGKGRRPQRLEELTTVAEPRVLVLVPTTQLAQQVQQVFRNLHCDLTIRSLVRASTAEEQKTYLKALDGCDVLISPPETLLPALLKHKLSLRRVRTLVLDEVDDIVSVNHFEPLKIILGALPKKQDRPQRLLFGASLPPAAYQMIKERMLLPSHRFVLADVKMNQRGQVVTVAGDTRGGLVTSPGTITHLVFMVGRVEKIQKLAWLYKTGKLNADQKTLIFCNSRHNVAYVRDRLQELVPDVHFTTLTSQSSATAREGVLKMFKSGVSTCLICTDLLSRGMDFHKVVYVVHYDMPTEMPVWIHRSGRCGRNGMPGYCYTFFQPENVRMAKPLAAHLRQNKQLIPPKLAEYAKQSFVDVFTGSLFHDPTRPYRRDDPQNAASALGRGTPVYPDYRQEGVQKHFRPQ